MHASVSAAVAAGCLLAAAPALAQTAPQAPNELATNFLLLDNYPVHRDCTSDDSAGVALAETAAMAQRRALYLGPGCIVIANAAALPLLANMAFIGEAVDALGDVPGQGTAFLITDRTVSPFRAAAQGNVAFYGSSFRWPAQTEAAAHAAGGPIAFPPMLTGDGQGHGISALRLVHSRVVNAYDLLAMDDGGQIGDVVMDDVRAYAVHDYFRMRGPTVEVWQISNSLFSVESDLDARWSVTNTLYTWSANNSTLFHAAGNGTPTAADTTGASIWASVKNSYVYGVNKVFWADRGCIQGRYDLGADAVQNILQLDPGGCLIDFSHDHGAVYATPPAGAGAVTNANPFAYTINQPSPEGAAIVVGPFDGGWFDHGIVSATGSNVGQIEVRVRRPLFAHAAPATGIQVSAGGGGTRILLQDAELLGLTPGSTGLDVEGPVQACIVRDTDFVTLAQPVLDNSTYGCVFTGNTSAFTTGPAAITGTGGATTGGANAWDKFRHSAATD